MVNELTYHFFDDDDFLMISNKIKEMEKITSGEIRIAIKEKVPLRKRSKEIRELAEEEFYRLKMDETRDKTGILIYVLLNNRQFYILTDSGIDEKVPQSRWDKIKDEMEEEFRTGHFAAGVLLSITKVGEALSEHFPIKADDTNELSNKVVF